MIRVVRFDSLAPALQLELAARNATPLPPLPPAKRTATLTASSAVTMTEAAVNALVTTRAAALQLAEPGLSELDARLRVRKDPAVRALVAALPRDAAPPPEAQAAAPAPASGSAALYAKAKAAAAAAFPDLPPLEALKKWRAGPGAAAWKKYADARSAEESGS